MKQSLKKGLSLWLAVLMVLTLLPVMPVHADSYTAEEYFTFVPATGTITGYDPAGGNDVSIPPIIDDVPVTAIRANAFLVLDTITSVVIPTGVTSIGDNAFSGCISLSSVTLPNGLTSIGSYAFAYSNNLSGSITIPASVTSIGEGAFEECWCITGVTIPEGITGIAPRTFHGCGNLSSVTLPSTLTSIGSGAFRNCVFGSITIPDSVTSIGDGAFDCCSFLSSLSLPDGLETIGDNAFTGCDGLKSITIPESVTSIGSYAFSDCSNLVSITLPPGITSIGYSTFLDCVALTSVTIPAGVTSIGSESFTNCGLRSVTIPAGVTSIGIWAFGKCSFLTSVTIPASVTHIGLGAFSYCSQLTSVYFLGDAPEIEYCPPDIDSDIFSFTPSCKVYYPYGATGWTNPWHGRDAIARCTVTYDSRGGSAVASATVNAGGLLSQPAAPARTGYTFGGWYREASLETPWNFASDTVTENITLYAKWNTIPNRKAGIPATTTASVTVNTAYTLNLATIFEDTDVNPLTYKVSVNGASDIGANANYSYTPSSVGNTTLVFKANDGTADSADTYTVTLAAANAFTVTGGELGTDYTYAGSTLTFLRPGSFGVSMQSGVTSTTIEKIVVSGTGSSAASPVNITLNGVDIRLSSGFPFDIQGSSHVNLTLTGANVLTTSGNYCAGLHVPVDSVLTIGGTGSLTAAGGLYGAGIGGDGDYGTCGTVTISGGTVHATGGSGGAGIGGGAYSSDSGTVTISGGSVTAMGGGDAAGIGGGFDGNGSTVLISGGTVTATGGNFGAGIGGGRGDGDGRGNGGTVTISGGTVTATGGTCGAGIGGGNYGSGGTVTLSGGMTFAEGKNGGKDIGAGYTGSGGSLNLSGTAALFLRNDSSVVPVTTTHTNSSYTGHGGGSIYGIPVAWTGSFGAYLRVYTLSYDVNSGSGTVAAPVTQLYSTTAAVSNGSGLSRASYNFDGWNTAANGGGTAYAPGSTFTFSADTVLYAQWSAIPYTLTYNLDGGVASPDNPVSYTIESDAITLNNPAKSGYTFTGWSGTGITGTLMSVTIPKGSTGNRSYTAHWAAIPTTGTITGTVTDGTNPVSGADVSLTVSGSVYSATTIANGNYSIANVPAGTGYTVTASKSGYTSGSATNVNVTANTTTQNVNITLTAIPPTTHIISVSANPAAGGTVTGGGTYNEGASVTVTATPNSGYTFTNWTEGGIQVSTAASYVFVMGNTNRTLTANFTTTSGGSGGSSGGSTPATPTTPTTPSSPVTTTPSADGKTTTATTDVKPTVNETTGTATATVAASVVTDMAAQAKAAEAAGQKAVVGIKVEAAPAAKEIAVEIPRDAFNKVAADTKANVMISTGLGTITFNEKAVDSISGTAGTGSVSISIAKVEASTLSPQVQAKVGNRPVYDFSVKAGSTEISKFGGGSAEISIPYTPKAGEKKNAIVVYYIDNKGTLQTVRGKYDPATGTVSFKTTHFSQYAVGYNEVSFRDVAATAWYNEAVSFIAARGITSGTGNGNYSPEARLTRGEFIVMLMKAYGIEPDTDLTNNFSDAGNTYYTGYLAAAKRLGISGGVGNHMFAPGKEITRQEMFTLLYNALKAIGELPEGTGKSLSAFNDAGQIAAWAKDAMTLFVETGTIGGSGGKLSPADSTTRAQMAQVLYNLLSK